ncbi:MAG: aspartyl protease family protein [Sphingomonas sp.]|uniref:aspartyl protease family protein n=1 Tax=Sphingomonas sp. TaxID=28214 RepID=UPI0025E03222|nr:aspartyl protease family protein [Sphingomonas sp.]MBY0284903.1 aspartyl protease family protein [Sphingomonas sp.]
MRAFLLALALMFGPAAALMPGTGIATLADDAEARWVAFDVTPGNQIRFTAYVNGVAAVAVLDTGVTASVTSPRFAALAKLKVQSRGMARAIGGQVPFGWATTRSIAFGALDRRGGGITVTALPASAIGEAQGPDLLVGQDLLAAYALEIDYAARRFRLLPSGRLPFRGETAPLRVSPEAQVYVTELTFSGQRLRPIVVDTGDGSAVTLSQSAWQATRPSALPTTSTIAYGLGGAQVSTMAIVPQIAIGRVDAREVELRIEPAGGFSQTIGAAGRIGSGLLERYHVLLDPGAGRMVLSPGPAADVPPLRSTSGLLTRAEGNRLRVLHVMRSSPAEASGWRDGDQICAIDGAPISADYARSRLAGWSIGTPGRVVAFGLCDGATRQLTLKRFY